MHTTPAITASVTVTLGDAIRTASTVIALPASDYAGLGLVIITDPSNPGASIGISASPQTLQALAGALNDAAADVKVQA